MAQVVLDPGVLAQALAVAIQQALSAGVRADAVSGSVVEGEGVKEQERKVSWADDEQEDVVSGDAVLVGGTPGEGKGHDVQRGAAVVVVEGQDLAQRGGRVEGTTCTDGAVSSCTEEATTASGGASAAVRVASKSVKSGVAVAAASGDVTWAQVARTGGDSSSSDGSEGAFVLPKRGFMKTYVHVPAVDQLAEELARLSGAKVSKAGLPDLALARFTAATVPAAFNHGRDKLQGLALVGDSAITTAVISIAYRSGLSLPSVQHLKVTVLTNQHMQRVFASCPLAKYMHLAGDVDLANSKTGATALEAFAGVLQLYATSQALVNFCVRLGLTKPLFSGVDAGDKLNTNLLDL